MKRLLLLVAVMAAMVTFGTSAEAGHRQNWGGGYENSGYGSWNAGNGFNQSYSPQAYSYPSYPTSHQTWHNTSHYDYDLGGYQRHGNHSHYVPGHYDAHRTGHYDTHLHH